MRIRYMHGPSGPWAKCFYCYRDLVAYDKAALVCDDCEAKRRPLVQRATWAVYRAVKAGKIQSARTLACADCGKPARCYDHRDYEKPLEVEPVCIGCNAKRGPAKCRSLWLI